MSFRLFMSFLLNFRCCEPSPPLRRLVQSTPLLGGPVRWALALGGRKGAERLARGHRFIVVFDANVLIRDFWWEGAELQRLQKNFFLSHQVVVPELALQEARAHLVRRVTEALTKLDADPCNPRALATLPRLFPRSGSHAGEGAEALGRKYEAFIRRTLRKVGGFVAPTPDIPLKTIVYRSIERTKPFNAGDKGFRDTLFWFTVLNLIQEYRNVSIVTANVHDFSDGHGNLHPTLNSETKKFISDYNRTFHFRSIEEFVAAFEHDGKVAADALRRALLRGRYKRFDLNRWLLRQIPLVHDQLDLDDVRWAGLPVIVENPQLREIEEIVAVDVYASEPLPRDSVRIFCRVTLTGIYQFSVLYDDYREVVASAKVAWVHEEDGNGWTEVGLRLCGAYALSFDISLDSAKAANLNLIPINCDFDAANLAFSEGEADEVAQSDSEVSDRTGSD